jgi:NADH:ubiquinone oxidoreductase subunit
VLYYYNMDFMNALKTSSSSSNNIIVDKRLRIWIAHNNISTKIPIKWNNFIHYIHQVDKVINKYKNNKFTSNRTLSLIFACSDNKYHYKYKEQYDLLNSNIIKQYRLEFMLERHSTLITPVNYIYNYN